MANTSIELPPGMSKEDFMKAFQAFQNARVSTARRDKINRAATKMLIEAHKAEYAKYQEEAEKTVE